MNRTNDIARYAEGLMEAGEQAAFEAELAADASLQQELALYHDVHASLQQHFKPDVQRDQLQHSLQNLRGEFFRSNATSTPARVVPFKRYLRNAVAIAAVLIAVVFIWHPWKSDLYKDYSKTTMLGPVERGLEVEQQLQEAATAFNNGDFETAAAYLERLHQQDPASSFVNFYYGVALLQTGKTPQAREIFNRLFAGGSVFKYEAAFYQGLSYLKEKDKRTCINWLQKIPADAPNYQKSQELLHKLQ